MWMTESKTQIQEITFYGQSHRLSKCAAHTVLLYHGYRHNSLSEVRSLLSHHFGSSGLWSFTAFEMLCFRFSHSHPESTYNKSCRLLHAFVRGKTCKVSSVSFKYPYTYSISLHRDLQLAANIQRGHMGMNGNKQYLVILDFHIIFIIIIIIHYFFILTLLCTYGQLFLKGIYLFIHLSFPFCHDPL